MELIITTPRELREVVAETVERAVAGLRAPAAEAAESRRWLTNREAMAYLGLSRSTLQRYRDDGTLPYSKVGANIFYDRADLDAVLEAHKTENPAMLAGARGSL